MLVDVFGDSLYRAFGVLVNDVINLATLRVGEHAHAVYVHNLQDLTNHARKVVCHEFFEHRRIVKFRIYAYCMPVRQLVKDWRSSHHGR